MKRKDLLVPIIGTILILFVALVLPGLQQANEDAEIIARIEALQARADAGPGTFFMPDSPDLDPNTLYLNAFATFDSDTYELTMFDSKGIIHEQSDVSQDELDELVEAEGWIQTQSKYSSDMGGSIHQFERDRL